ncbi:MAG TPA: carbamate kinase [Gaiellales bacterium]|nr:carbamate kinase [Gaiellales bacterium]
MTAHAHLPLAVVALGGNALLRPGRGTDAGEQRQSAEAAAAAIAELTGTHRAVVTHGNGPQVGRLALPPEADRETIPQPLDVLDAEADGMIGYMLQQALQNALPSREVATVLTQVVVDRYDPAFRLPTRPIGPSYERAAAEPLRDIQGWTIAAEGDRARRLVPSPQPLSIVELGVIRRLVEQDVLVICAGGGGIPVFRDAAGRLRGAEAMVDEDMAAGAALAEGLDADLLLMLTDVDGVYSGWGTAAARAYRTVSPAVLAEQRYQARSMAPKERWKYHSPRSLSLGAGSATIRQTRGFR